ncbi:hypothetical protein BKA66DRAFT_577553 [Pyrenochaeta sp. MPI-SDFR-AT-0127]|nr:hypothetical protein BKA66DRAFT_577553 [Pyrenochaeta sp. MPI-SDFR-AT-0127]
MVRIDKARDNYKSVAMKRWTREPHYPSDLVEAYAHKVFDCLLEQAKDGFRGWHHNDYVVDDRKGNDEDRDIDCEGRLNNIILALEQEKTICEDVMNSACQIRMFVNAPVAYSNRKHQNRIGNSKRPNGGAKEEPQPGSRPHKVRKIGDRRARNRSPVVSISASVDQEQVHELAGLASFVAPSSRQLAPSPLEKVYHSLQVPTAHRISMLPQHPSTLVDQAQTNVLLEPMISPQMLPHTPRLVPKPHVSSASPSSLSLLSPPILPQGNFSAPVTPDQIGSRNTNVLSGRWIPTDTFSKFPYGNIQQPSHANDLLFNHVADWSQNVSPYYPCETGTRNNLFEHHPELGVALADVEQQSMSPFDRNTINNLNVSPFEQQQYGAQ